MTLLGDNLENLSRKHVLSLESIVNIGHVMIDWIWDLHRIGFIHRDIKPDNFLIGRSKEDSQIFMIDFGLSKQYLNKDKTHIKFITGKSLIGTARYSSVSAHEGNEQGRRDDLMSIFFVLIYFFKGSLPWQGIHHDDQKKKFELILKKKQRCGKELVEGIWAAEQFWEIYEYILKLKFEEEPDYDHIKRILDKIKDKYCFPLKNKFEWEQNTGGQRS